MAQSRRNFIHKSLALGSMFPLFSMSEKRVNDFVFNSRNKDESYWKDVASLYKQNVNFINLESGYFSPSPESVKNFWIDFVNEINESPSYYMRTKQTKMREKVRETLANYSGVSSEEICLTRNTTESMNIIIQGLKIGNSDEIFHDNFSIDDSDRKSVDISNEKKVINNEDVEENRGNDDPDIMRRKRRRSSAGNE